MAPKQSRPRLRRILIAIAAAAALVLVLLCAAVFLAPRIASTDKARDILVSQLEKSLESDVAIDNIKWTWSGGITLSGFRIAGPPGAAGAAPFVSAPRVRLEIDYGKLLDRCLGLALVLEAPEIHLVRSREGRLLLPLPREAEKKPEEPKKPGEKPGEKPGPAEAFRLPADIDANIRLENGLVEIDDRSRKSRLAVTDLNLQVKAPSIIHEPAEVTVSARASADGQKLPQSRIHVRVRNLFDKTRALRIERAKGRVAVSLPGASIKIAGDMEDAGLTADLRLDIKPLCRAAAAFAPGIFQPLDASGRLELDAQVSQKAPRNMAFSAELSGSGLAAGGEILQNRSIGPGNVRLSAAGRLDLEQMGLEIERAVLELLQNSRIACTGSISGINRDSPRLDLTMAPLSIDIRELFAFGKAFLPPGISLGGPEAGTSLSAERIHLQGQIPSGELKARIQGARLEASELRAEAPLLPAAAMSLADMELVLSEVRAGFSDLFPKKAQISGSLELESLDYATETGSLRLKRFLLKKLALSAEGISAAENSPYGVAADVEITQAAEMGSFMFKDIFSLTGLSQELKLALRLEPDGGAAGTVSRLRLAGEKLRLTRPEEKPVELPVALEMGVASLALQGIKAGQMTMEGLSARVDMGELASANLEAELAEGGRKHFAASADAQISAGKAAELLCLGEQSGLKTGGRADITLEVSGRLPRQQEIEGLQSLALSGNLGFLQNCRLRASLADAFLALPANQDSAGLRIGKIAADPLLSYNLTGENASGRMQSRIHFENAGELFLAEPRPPLSGTISLDIRHKGAEHIEGRQEIRLMPGEIRQYADFAWEGIQKALTRGGLFARAAAVNGRAGAGISVADGSALAGLLQSEGAMDASGSLNAGIRMEKQPDNRVRLCLDIGAEAFSAAMDERFSVTGLDSRIALEKTLKLVRGRAKQAERTRQKWLSRELLETSPRQTGRGRGAASPQGALGETESEGLSFASARFQAGSLPLVFGPSRLRLGLYQGLPQVEAFAINMLGGTLTGNISLQKESSGYRAETGINFTGISPAALFAGRQSGGGSAREISGALYAGLPLTTEMETMLENTEIRMNFREIGAKALERLLYAIDPHEENEAIVSQRRLLRLGSPRSIRVRVKDGFLSLSGAIAVKSVPVSIPPLNRLNIARIPGLNAYGSALSALAPVISALDTASADTLALEPANHKP